MRTAWIRTLTEIAARDPRVCLVVGDLGYTVVEGFVEQCPGQYVNAGVAEQNMTGLAAGMALSGKIVFTYSIANFPVLRCLEQVRNDVCYHGANVKVVSIGGGYTYGSLGVTHHGTEELAVMRTLPGMTVVAPGDPVEAALATRALVERPGPAYVRLGKAGEPVIHEEEPDFEIGRPIEVRSGADLAILTTGGVLGLGVEAAELLQARGIDAGVHSVHTLKPLDEARILSLARGTGHVVTLEEHSRLGGLGGAVAEVLAEAGVAGLRFRRLGLPDGFATDIGSQAYMRERAGLTPKHVAAEIQRLIRDRAPPPRGSA